MSEVSGTADEHGEIAPPDVDVWKQVHDLWKAYSRKWKVRSDLVVTALGPDRTVRLQVGSADVRRNVNTMRELAAALLAACDFVEMANPRWASRSPEQEAGS